MQAGSLRQIAWATRIQAVPVDDPRFWQSIAGLRGIDAAEPDVADNRDSFAGSTSYGTIKLGLGHIASFFLTEWIRL